jgi:hypothetical protein
MITYSAITRILIPQIVRASVSHPELTPLLNAIPGCALLHPKRKIFKFDSILEGCPLGIPGSSCNISTG